MPLEDVVWIGGSPCAGKSTVAARLAETYGATLYRLDDHTARHLAEAGEREPLLVEARGMTMDEVWSRPVDVLLAQELEFYAQEWRLVVRDLEAVAGPVVAEGTGMLPGLVPYPGHGFWLVPSEEFQLDHYARRSWVAEILDQCHDPDEAWRHWMGRDVAFARVVAGECRERGLAYEVVDGTRSVEQITTRVTEHLLASGILT